MSKAYVSAVAMLARREHGAAELMQKLALKGYLVDEIQNVLTECQRLELQSDERFVESVCRARIRQGYGPERIRQELKNKHIDRELVDKVLMAESDNWVSYATDVWRKKYKQHGEASYLDRQKQKQFLLYRGFSMPTISLVFECITHE
ncbi:MAG: recombination regulator RecX [Legionellaceae bacterium]|nr:recombination regulator RecX [Legionellaceae bacterium]